MDEVGIHPAVQVVQAYFSARQADGYEAARAYWADDAVWHITGSHQGAGDYSPDGYLDFQARWREDHPSYAAQVREMSGFGDELAILLVESRGGPSPGVASGVAIFRVVNGRIVEGWAIPAFASGRHPF